MHFKKENRALNMWATMHKKMHIQKANETFSKFLGELCIPVRILGAIAKYKEKGKINEKRLGIKHL